MLKEKGYRPEYYLNKAEEYAAKNSTCTRTKVGAIIVNSGKIISCGANRTRPGIKDCSQCKCPKEDPEYAYALWDEPELCRGIHAEWDAILKADRDELIKATIYVTHEPCFICTKIIFQVGIERVFYKNEFTLEPAKLKRRFIEESGLVFQMVNMDKFDETVMKRLQYNTF